MANFVLRAGIEFTPDERSKRSIRQTVTKALSNFSVSIARATFSRAAKAQLQSSFRTIAFQINRVSLSATARSALRGQLTNLPINVGQVKLGGAAINQLRTQFSSIPFTINNVRLGRQARAAIDRLARQQQRAAAAVAPGGAAPAGGAGARGAAAQVVAVRNQVSANQQLKASNEGVQSSFQGAGLSAEAFGARLVTITARFATYLVAIRAILLVQQAFRESLESIVEFDSILQDLRKVVRGTPADLAVLSEGIFDVAQKTGASLDEVSVALNTFVRQVGGGDIEGALRKTEAAIVAVNISELNAGEATKFITSSLKIFGNELQNEIQALDILSVTADNAATTAGEVGRAFIRASSTAKLTGVSFRELTAFITATIDRTQEAGTKVGTALKTIFTRLQTNSKVLRENANALGANIAVNDSLFTVLQKLNVLFGTLDETQQTQLATLVAGRRQVNIFAGLVNSFGKAQDLLAIQTDAAGTALQKQGIEQEKISTQVSVLTSSLKELIVVLSGVDEGAEGIGGVGDAFSLVITNVSDAVQGFTAFVRTIQEAEVFGLRLSSVFSGVGKAILLIGGAAIVRGLIRGITAAITGTRNLTSSINAATTAMGGLTLETNRQATSEKTALAIEKQRLGVIQQITAATKGFVATPVAGGQNNRGTTQGASLLRQTGVLIALQLVGDVAANAAGQIRTTAGQLEEAGEAASVLNAGLLDASAAGLQFGGLVGILSGSIRTGLLVGLGAAAIALTRFAFAANQNAEELLLISKGLGGAVITGAQAIATGSDALVAVLQEQADRSGIPLEQAEVNLATALNRATQRLEEGVDGISSTLEGAGVLIEQVQARVSRIIRSAQLQTNVRRSGAAGRAQERVARLAAEGGQLVSSFREFDRLTASSAKAAEAIVGPLKSSALVSATLVRSMELFQARQDDASATATELVSKFALQSPELRNANAELDKQKALLEDQSKELEKIRENTEGVLKASQEEVSITIEPGAISKNLQTLLSTAINRVVPGQGENLASKLFQEIQGEGERVNLTFEQLNQRLQALGVERLTSTSSAVVDLQKEFANIVQNQNTLIERRNQLDKTTQTISGEIKDIESARENLAKKQIDLITKQVGEVAKLVQFTKTQISVADAQTAALKEQTADTNIRLAFERQLRTFRQDGLSSEEELNEVISRGNQQINERLRLEERGQQRFLDRIRTQAAEFDRLGLTPQAKELENSANALERAFAMQRGQLKAQIQADVQIEIEGEFERFIQDQERALADFRITEIQRVLSEEQRIADGRIQLIREIADTPVGAEVFRDILRTVPTQIVRQFGRTSGAILKIQENQLNQFARSVETEFELLSSAGLSSIEKVRKAQELQGELLQRNQEQIDNRRESALDRARTAIDRVNQSEEQLITARNEIPAANQKVIESQRTLASANAAVESSTTGLFKASQNVSDAQADLSFQSQFATFQIRQQSGAFTSIGQEFAQLRGIFQQVTNDIRVSETQRLQFARQIAQEQLNLIQQQFNALQSLGQRAATASADQLVELQTAIGAAAAISTGQADVGQFGPEIIQAIASIPEGLFPGLQRAISEFGLSQLGIDPSVLEQAENEAIQIARINADANKEQLIAANEQVVASRQQIADAEAARSFAQDQLNVSQEQREAILQNVAVAQAGFAGTRLGLVQTSREVARTLNSINSNVAATRQVDSTLKNIASILQNQTANIASAISRAITGRGAGAATAAGGGGGGTGAVAAAALGASTALGGGPGAAGGGLKGAATTAATATTASTSATRAATSATTAGITATKLAATASKDLKDTFVDALIDVTEFGRDVTGSSESLVAFEKQLGAINSGPLAAFERLLGSLGQRAGEAINSVTPNFAGGSLTGGEFASVFRAAKKEKRAMPPGSQLMVANTSEAVLTRKQARAVGIRPIPKSNAQDGNVVAETGSLQQAATLLNTTLNSLLTKVNSPGFIEQNINVTVDTERNLNIRGVAAFDSAVRTTLAEKFGTLAPREELDAIAGGLGELVRKLNEEGIVNAQGT